MLYAMFQKKTFTHLCLLHQTSDIDFFFDAYICKYTLEDVVYAMFSKICVFHQTLGIVYSCLDGCIHTVDALSLRSLSAKEPYNY